MTMTPLLLSSLFLQCAPNIAPETLTAIVAVESATKPYVIANVSDNTSHAFDEKGKAIDFLNRLATQGKNFSAGLMQINSKNFGWLGLNNETVFDYCENIKAGSRILQKCYQKASKSEHDEQTSLRNALSCYYSGNFKRGYQKEASDGKSYIERIEQKLTANNNTVPAIKTNAHQQSFIVGDSGIEEWDIFHDYKN